MTTLALDTSTPCPSVAVVAGADVLATHDLGAAPGGGRRVLEAVDEALRIAEVPAADLRRIVVGVGPGGFTGIRIGIATALGLGQACGAEVVGASSLEALASGIDEIRPGAEVLAPVIDARRGEVFAALYRPGVMLETIEEPRAWSPDALATRIESIGSAGVAAAGDGLAAHEGLRDALGPAAVEASSPVHHPRAVALVRRADAGAGRPARPVYCRLPDAEEKRRAREAAGG